MGPLVALIFDCMNEFFVSALEIGSEYGAKVLIVSVSLFLDNPFSRVLKPRVIPDDAVIES